MCGFPGAEGTRCTKLPSVLKIYISKDTQNSVTLTITEHVSISNMAHWLVSSAHSFIPYHFMCGSLETVFYGSAWRLSPIWYRLSQLRPPVCLSAYASISVLLKDKLLSVCIHISVSLRSLSLFYHNLLSTSRSVCQSRYTPACTHFIQPKDLLWTQTFPFPMLLWKCATIVSRPQCCQKQQ